MTASVSTRGMINADFTAAEREKMYVEALTYYIEHLLRKDNDQKIVFAENSGWDLENIKSKLPAYDDKRIEFISLSPEDFDVSRGKGYNDMLIINKVVEKSETIKHAGAFFKVTGRYPVYNMEYFLCKASKVIYGLDYDLYCDIKDHKLYDWLRLGWNGHSFECRMFGVKRNWYLTEMAPLYNDCYDFDTPTHKRCAMETVLFKKVKNGGGRFSTRFKREPHFGGLEGANNIHAFIFTKNQDSAKGKLKRFVGNMIRTFTPWFKF